MGFKFQLLAARYPFKGYYEASFQCSTLLGTLIKFIKLQRQGYEIINVSYRDIKESFTWAFTEDE